MQRAAFVKVLMLCDKNIPDLIWMIEEEGVLCADAEIDRVAVFMDGALQIAERVTAKLSEVAAEKLRLRARGKARTCHLLLLITLGTRLA